MFPYQSFKPNSLLRAIAGLLLIYLVIRNN
jgi:hypothetical protein